MSYGAQQIHNVLEHLHGLGKWGWVIYRTSYKDDAAWDRFQRYVNEWSREALKEDGASALVSGAVDWTFVSDPALAGASREQLRERFHEWRKTAIWAENPRMHLLQTSGDIPQRYVCFVQVDEDALNSVAQGSKPDQDAGAVHFVRCDDEMPRLPGWWGDDFWPMLSKKIVSIQFWETIGTSIQNPGVADIDEVMDDEMRELEWERKMRREKETLASGNGR